jgi:arginase
MHLSFDYMGTRKHAPHSFPFIFSQIYLPQDHGPKLLRQAGLLEHLASIGWRVHDSGDLEFMDHAQQEERATELLTAKNSQIVGRGCELVANAVMEAVKGNRFPLILGGDHSIGAGTLAGLMSVRPNTGIIWVDAHADINTPEISESGNMHGMPVGLMLKGLTNPSAIPGFEWLGSPDMKHVRLNPDSIVYVGLRDVDPKERLVLRQNKIKTFTMYDIDKFGIGGVMEQTLDYLLCKDSDRPLHLSYDIDAVDPILAPATGTAVRGGLTYREAHYVAEAVVRSGNLASAEIVELNPTLSDGDGSSDTVELGLGLVTSMMGKSII